MASFTLVFANIKRSLFSFSTLIALTIVLLCNTNNTTKAQTVFGEEQIISNNVNDAWSVYAIDLDGDGDNDVLSASYYDGKIAWYANDGNSNFSTEQIISTNANGADFVYAIDLDGDGDNDVLSASRSDNKIAWYENDGIGNFGEQQIISINAINPISVYAIDVDNDGDNDVLSAFSSNNKIVWYENDGNGNFSTEQIISTNAIGASSVYAIDIDADGDNDVLSASTGNDKIAWYENDGNGNFSDEQIISTNANGANSVYAIDLDSDGDNDVLSTSRYDNKIAWYANDGVGNFSTQQIISTNANGAWSVYAIDLDNDGDNDVLSASYDANKIVWYANDGNGNFSTEQIINTNAIYATSVYATDIDGDGDNDVLSASYGDSKIAWYENFLNDPKISGHIFYDANQNGLFDNSELTLDNQNTQLQPANAVAYSNTNGLFMYAVEAEGGTYQLNYTPPFNWQATTPTQYNITLAPNQSSVNNNFGIYPDTMVTIVKPYIASGINRCNWQVPYTISYLNEGTTLTNGIIYFTPDELMGYISSNPAPDSIAANGSLYWYFYNLPPYQQNQINMLWQMPDANFTGDTLSNIAVVNAVSVDSSSAQSYGFGYRPVVLCSFDPNDKQVTPAGVGEANYTLMNEELIYTIRFQNTGNDTAFAVVVRDTLATNLDWSTFRPITSSHAMQVLRNADGLITFTFNNINLPDSTTNEAASHGFIMYAVRPQTNLPNATNISNTAYIYFDQNDPVITNSTQNMLVYELPNNNPLPIELAYFTGKTQLNGNLLQWKTFTELNNDYFVLQRSTDGKNFVNIGNVNAAANGAYSNNYQFLDTAPKQNINYYRLLSVDFDGTQHYSLVIVLDNSANPIFTLSPNPANNQVTLSFTTPINTNTKILLTDLSGKTVTIYNNPANNQSITINRHNLPKGLYFVQVQDANSNQVLGVSKVVFE